MSTRQTHQDAPGSTQRPSLGSEPHLGTRKRLLERLERGAAWTMDLRREPERYGANPADGVYVLRNLGWDIRTLRAWIQDYRFAPPSDYRDYYVLVQGSKEVWSGARHVVSSAWKGGKPVFGSMLAPKWHKALLKAWEREP